MAYPTLPSQVGLTVAKSGLSVVTSNTIYSSNATISNTFFQRQVRVTDGAIVDFDNCWFVPNQTTYGFGDVALRIGVDTSVSVTRCEFGITAVDAQTYLGGNGSWIAAYGTQVAIECPNVGPFTGSVLVEGSYFHHVIDGIRPQGGWTIRDSYIADLAMNLEGFHGDCIQFNRGVVSGSTALVERCYLRANLHPDTLFDDELSYANRAVFVKPDEADIDGSILVDGCYLDSDGFYPASTTSDEVYGFGASAVVHWSNNTIGRSATVDAIADQAPGTWVSSFSLNTLESVMSATFEAKATANVGGGVPLVLTIPTEASTDDIVLVGIRISTNSAGSWTKPADAVEIQVETSTIGSAFILGVWYYVVKSTDTPGTTTLSFQYSVASNHRGTILSYTGGDPSAPVAASAKAFDGSSFDTNFPAPAVTTTENDQTVVTFYASRQNTSVSSHSPAATEREDTTDSSGVLAIYDYLRATAGDTGGHSVTAAASNYNAGITVALASGGGANLEASASLAGTGTLTANAVVTRFASAALAGSGTLAVDAQRTTFGAAALSGAGALTAAAQRTTFASVALAGVGTLLAGSQSAPVALVPPRPSVRPGRLAGLLNQGVLVINRSQTGPPDEYGTPTWTESEFVTVCHVQPISTEEMAARPADRVRYRAWFPAGTAIGAPDRIVLASGLEAEVVGSALAWFNPRRRTESHLVVDLADVSDEATGGS